MHLAIVPPPDDQAGPLKLQPCPLCGSADQVVELEDGAAAKYHCGTDNRVFQGGAVEWEQHLHRRQARQAELAAERGVYPPLRPVD